jgi:hypothetical protein
VREPESFANLVEQARQALPAGAKEDRSAGRGAM